MAEKEGLTLCQRIEKLPEYEKTSLLAGLLGVVEGYAELGHKSSKDTLKLFIEAVEIREEMCK